MIIIPAIDLIDGKCVRLYKGNYDSSTVYNEDPVETAKEFEQAGAVRIHIVDLDAARGGSNNRDIIKRIKKEVSCTVETGGGIRTEDDIKELIDCGIDRMIAGTVFAKTPEVVAGWIETYGKKFIAGIDALDGEVRVSGWEKGSGVSDSELSRKAAEIGIISIIYTNIAKDGTLSGPDLENTIRITKESGLPSILSGGISSIDDLKAVAENSEASGIRGIITGKALYEGRLDLVQAIKEYQDEDSDTGW